VRFIDADEVVRQPGRDGTAAGRFVSAHSQSALGAFCHRLKARLGTPKPMTATAHTRARLVYTMLKHGVAYVAQGMAEYEQRYQERVVQHLARRVKVLGYALVKTPEGAPASPPGSRSNALEGPQWSRDRRPLGADFLHFSVGWVPAP
jgi:hypothetical protein